MELLSNNSRAQTITWDHLVRWSVNSNFICQWYWPEAYIKRLSTVIKKRVDAVDKASKNAEDLKFISISFSGDLYLRELEGDSDIKGNLFYAYSGDIVYSKIDIQNGAIGIIPNQIPIAVVTSEFPVYTINTDKALPEYLQLLIKTNHFMTLVNSLVSGASGRKRVQPSDIESALVPIPSLDIQKEIVNYWLSGQKLIAKARELMHSVINDLNKKLEADYLLASPNDVLTQRSFNIKWSDMRQWDVKSTHASFFKLANPDFVPMSSIVEEVVEFVRPWEEPDKEWPVYGVNNSVGIFLNQHKKGYDFNAPYKRIRQNWFFHNPTRANVGSLGIVPNVPDDAITSPEYQVWRIKDDTPPGYIAVLINTSLFLRLVDIYRVGAVKQRLYTEGLLRIPIPPQPRSYMIEIEKKEIKHYLR